VCVANYKEIPDDFVTESVACVVKVCACVHICVSVSVCLSVCSQLKGHS